VPTVGRRNHYHMIYSYREKSPKTQLQEGANKSLKEEFFKIS
jgi:hypothetical protein